MSRVMQLIDSLDAGGAERLSVSLANILAEEIDVSYLCTTRSEGLLKSTINQSVGYLFLEKKSIIDLNAIIKLRKFIKKNDINVMHAHSTSYFLATLVKLSYPKLKLVWHDHYGDSEFLEKRPKLALKICSLFFSNIFSVNELLLNWAKENLYCKNVSYLQNFVALSESKPTTHLKGVIGKRIVSLANLRPQKDHITLFKAFKGVVEFYPDWTLHCIGKDFKDAYSRDVKRYIIDNDLENNIYIYGSQSDITHILSQSSVGVLSSKSEGLPIALLEYGYAKLAVITTDVGNCGLVVSTPKKGLLVEAQNEKALRLAIIALIKDEAYRILVSENLHNSIIDDFSKEAIITELLKVYNK